MSVGIRYASGESVAAGTQLVIEEARTSKVKNDLFIFFPLKPMTPSRQNWFPNNNGRG